MEDSFFIGQQPKQLKTHFLSKIFKAMRQHEIDMRDVVRKLDFDAK